MSTIIEIVLAHFNGSQFLGEQIESIQKNELPAGTEIQITVMDDRSKDEEFARLKEICARWPNVKIHRNEINLGVVRTFEEGLQKTHAPYLMLCDQDDVWLPNKIAATFQKLKEIEGNGPALVFTELKIVDAKLAVIAERMLNKPGYQPAEEKYSLLFQNLSAGCTMMFNRKLLDFALPFPASIPMHDHWLTVCAAFAGNIGFVETPTILYRQHSHNVVGQSKRSLLERARKPFRTRKQFDTGLIKKGMQALELSKRLPQSADKAVAADVADAFLHRSLTRLRFLIRTKVFAAGSVSLALICMLYLLPQGRELNAAK